MPKSNLRQRHHRALLGLAVAGCMLISFDGARSQNPRFDQEAHNQKTATTGGVHPCHRNCDAGTAHPSRTMFSESCPDGGRAVRSAL